MRADSLYYLVYASYTTKNWSIEDLNNLLNVSRKRNRETGITGMLVYLNDRFLQVLEGERLVVKGLYDKIKTHTGHRDFMTLLDGDLKSRNFEYWSMGFERVDMATFFSMTGFENIEKFINLKEADHPSVAFLKMFYKKHNSTS